MNRKNITVEEAIEQVDKVYNEAEKAREERRAKDQEWWFEKEKRVENKTNVGESLIGLAIIICFVIVWYLDNF